MKNILIATSQNGEIWTESILPETEFSFTSAGYPIGLFFVTEENKFYAYFALGLVNSNEYKISYSTSTDGIIWTTPETLYEVIETNFPVLGDLYHSRSYIFYYNGSIYFKKRNTLIKSSLTGANQTTINLTGFNIGDYDDNGFNVAIHDNEIILINKYWALYSSDGITFTNKTVDWSTSSYIDDRFNSVFWSNELNCFFLSHKYNDPSFYWSNENYVGTVVNGVITNRYRFYRGELLTDEDDLFGSDCYFFYTNKTIDAFNTSYFYISTDGGYLGGDLEIRSNVYGPSLVYASTIDLDYFKNIIFMDSYFLITNAESIYKVNLDSNKNVVSTKFIPDTLSLDLNQVDTNGIVVFDPQFKINNISNPNLTRLVYGETGLVGGVVQLGMLHNPPDDYVYFTLGKNAQEKFVVDKNRLPSNFNFKFLYDSGSLFFNQYTGIESSLFPGLRTQASTIDLISMTPDGSGYLDIVVRINNILDFSKENYGNLTFYQNLFVYVDDVEYSYHRIDYITDPNVEYAFYISLSSFSVGIHNIKFILKDAYNPIFPETHSSVYQFTK